ncbi:DedA family protein [Bacillus kexueae]|uniref:DedA family protein n=1 Tax=Aeribacillus kexueae TaxID=2078952 RepID=UPI001FB028D2|nr:DedA family protein [Bacillus kexueae]
MEAIIDWLINEMKDLSYMGIILALTIEIVPGELVLPLVGYWVYTGEMSFFWAVVAGVIGGTTGPLTLYALGYYAGRPFLEKYGKWMFISPKTLAKSDQFFEKHGAFVAFSGRFLPGVRSAISLPCGMGKMSIFTFTLFTFVAMIPITVLYIYLGYTFGGNIKEIEHYLNQWFWPTLFFLLLLYMVWNKWQKRKISIISWGEFTKK